MVLHLGKKLICLMASTLAMLIIVVLLNVLKRKWPLVAICMRPWALFKNTKGQHISILAGMVWSSSSSKGNFINSFFFHLLMDVRRTLLVCVVLLTFLPLAHAQTTFDDFLDGLGSVMNSLGIDEPVV